MSRLHDSTPKSTSPVTVKAPIIAPRAAPEQLQQSLNRIEVISFDLDETLWPLESVIEKAEATLYQWMQANTPRVTDSCSPPQLLEMRKRLAAEQPALQGDVTRMRKHALQAVFSEFGYSTELVDKAFDVFFVARSQVTLYNGARELLERLKGHYKLAALTNGNADLSIVGIDHLFDDIQLASLENPAKPDPAMFVRCAANLGVDTRAILHVGDNPQTDVGGGINAGTMTVWFNQQHESWPDQLPCADIELASLNQLELYLPGLAN